MGVFSQVAKLVDEGAKRIKAYHGSPNLNSQMAGRHPSDNADMSALQLAPHMAKGLINDVARYGKQAVTGQVSDTELLPQQPLTGNAKSIADAAGSAMGTALNYQVPSLLRGPRSAMDDINMVVDAYQGVRPGIVDAIGEPSVNRVEGAGLLGSMFIPAKVPKPKSGGLFSQAVIASDNLQRKTGNADGFFNDLTGKGQVKPDELNAMGFKENFAGRNDVSRDEVRQFVNDNQVQIKETQLGGGGYGIFDEDGVAVKQFDNQSTAYEALENYPQNSQEGYFLVGKMQDQTKFGSYTLDGGDNYRELLMSLPNDDVIAKVHDLRTEFSNLLSRTDNISVARKSEIKEQLKPLETLYEGFSSSHFDKPNILAHLRMKDRVDTDGNKTLLLEEVQSDWHQTGADRGYKNPKRLSELNNKITQLDTEIKQARAIRDRPDDEKLLTELGFDVDVQPYLSATDKFNLEEKLSELLVKRESLDSERRRIFTAVPDAPFKTDDKSSWYNLALKRGLLEAVEGGYDKLALTTGRQQADRYDLSKQINEVRLGGNEQSGFTVSAFDNYDNPVIMESIDSLDKLPNLIGKDAAKSLVDQPLTDTTSGSARILAGQDLSVGGEGMKQFYDRTLPNALGKLVKQDGVKVSESNLIGKTPFKTEIASASDREELITLRDKIFNGDDTSPTHDRYNELLAKYQPKPRTDTVHSIDITPKMRERVKKGLPMFATGGAVIGLGELMRQQQQEKEAGSGLLHSL